jgi:nitrite reductase/ring-hydroxylating ferredoxin subunit
MTTWRRVCAASEIRDGEPFGAKLDGTPIGLFRVDGQIHAVSDVCTHEFALLSQGWQDGRTIECPLHAAKFDVVTGKCLAAPARDDLAVYAVKLDGDDVLVALPTTVG